MRSRLVSEGLERCGGCTNDRGDGLGLFYIVEYLEVDGLAVRRILYYLSTLNEC